MCLCMCMYINNTTVCIQQFLPCGVMICAGLAGALIFHVVRVPSEWLQTNCLPSWCQATEWIALKTHSSTSTEHDKWITCKLYRIRLDYSIMFFLLSTNSIDRNLVCLLNISDFHSLWHSNPFVIYLLSTEHTSL